ncbi:DUF1643 domain-containing protein [Bradyrhizobium sp. Pha-3]|uniref:DUF1643 domain-containing protein n=1 Tax=Bradyrhizobium sp. Pha-3 TaxID=208375 RepID=UPI0035D40259
MNHRWGDPVRFPHKTEHECLNGCRTIKVTRHESEAARDVVWPEFWRDGEKIEGDSTPECEPVAVGGCAVFSPDRMYRYRLERELPGEGIIAAIIMVNGSDADETSNDHTVRKLIGFGTRLGWRRIIIGNLFAFVSTDISGLRTAADPIGSDNDRHLEEIIAAADIVIVGWGTVKKLPEALRKRWIDVVRIADRLGQQLYCLDVTDDGHPKHPLMIGYDAVPHPWDAPWFPNRVPAGLEVAP